MKQVTVNLSNATQIEKLENVVASYEHCHDANDPFNAYHWNKATPVEIAGDYHNGTGYMDSLSSIDLPGEVGDTFKSFDWEYKRRIILVKGQCGMNIALFDRNSLDAEGRSRRIALNVGDAYRGLVPSAIFSKDEFEDVINLPKVLKRSYEILKEQEAYWDQQ